MNDSWMDLGGKDMDNSFEEEDEDNDIEFFDASRIGEHTNKGTTIATITRRVDDNSFKEHDILMKSKSALADEDQQKLLDQLCEAHNLIEKQNK